LQRERQQQRWIWVFAAVVVLVVMAIPAYGYYATFVAPPRRTAFEVNGVKHSLGEVANVTRAQVAVSVASGGQADLSTLPLQVWTNLLNDEIISQKAPSLGIMVTQEEVDAEVRSRLLPPVTAGQQQPDPDTLNRELRNNLRKYLDITKFSEAEYREIVRRSLVRQKLQDMLSAQIPQVQDQVFVNWIHVTDDTAASNVENELKAGDPFDRLARVYGVQDSYANDSGEVGWIPKGAFPPLDGTLFSIEHDKVSDPIYNPPDTYFIKVTAGPELREVSSQMRGILSGQAMQTWLDDQYNTTDIKASFGDKEYSWVIDKSRELIPGSATPTSP